MLSRGSAVAVLASLAALGTSACASSGEGRGRLVVHVSIGGGLTPDGSIDEQPGSGARVIVSGRGRTLRLRADSTGTARARLRPGHYRVRLPTSSSSSSSPRTVIIHSGRTTVTRLSSACSVC